MNKASSHAVAFALGSNLGDCLDNLRRAVKALSPFIDLSAFSPVYKTTPAYVTDQPVFFNAVVVGTTTLEPLPLLWKVKSLEKELGRTPTFRYGPRVIDIDILFYDKIVLDLPELTIPHPRMQERDFVLQPLSDVAPDWTHPKIGQTPHEMRALLPEGDMICLGPLLP